MITKDRLQAALDGLTGDEKYYEGIKVNLEDAMCMLDMVKTSNGFRETGFRMQCAQESFIEAMSLRMGVMNDTF